VNYENKLQCEKQRQDQTKKDEEFAKELFYRNYKILAKELFFKFEKKDLC